MFELVLTLTAAGGTLTTITLAGLHFARKIYELDTVGFDAEHRCAELHGSSGRRCELEEYHNGPCKYVYANEDHWWIPNKLRQDNHTQYLLRKIEQLQSEVDAVHAKTRASYNVIKQQVEVDGKPVATRAELAAQGLQNAYISRVDVLNRGALNQALQQNPDQLTLDERIAATPTARTWAD